jgi:hypothetical protein
MSKKSITAIVTAAVSVALGVLAGTLGLRKWDAVAAKKAAAAAEKAGS